MTVPPGTQPASTEAGLSPVERQSRALARLRALLVDRSEARSAIDAAHRDALEAAQDAFDEATAAAETRWSAEKRRVEDRSNAEHADARSTFEARASAEQRGHQAARRSREAALDDAEQAAKSALDDAETLADAGYEPAMKAEDDAVKRLRADVRAQREALDFIEAEAARLAGPRVPMPPSQPAALGHTPDGDGAVPHEWREREGPTPLELVAEKRAELEDRVRRLGGITLHAAFRAGLPILLLVAAFIGGVFAGAIRTNWTEVTTPLLWAGAGVAAVVVVTLPLRVLALGGTRRRLRPIAESLKECRHLLDVAVGLGDARRRQAKNELDAARTAEVQRTRDQQKARLAQLRAERDKSLGDLDARHASVMAQLTAARDTAMSRVEREREAAIEAAEAAYSDATAEASQRHESARAEADRVHADATAQLRTRFDTEATSLVGTLRDTAATIEPWSPAWSDPSWPRWTPPTTPAAHVPLGWIALDLATLEGGLPEDRSPDIPRHLRLPVAVGFPGDASLLIEAGEPHRSWALDTLRDTVTRLLTALPAGKVRLTMFDPVGLGQSFAGFMRLSDHDDRLVTNRIWTEARQLEQRLTDLTEHMETVIQKYLRNEFDTIEAYNDAAGEIAEPYRFLVIADLPQSLTEEAARRLTSIIESGPRCGVYTLIHVDPDAKLPETITRETLARAACVVTFDEDATARVRGDAYDGLSVELESPPNDADAARLLDLVGRHGVDAGRVEVPFRLLGPPDGKLWTETCDDELRIPLGRAGATRFQQLALGKGTSQHVLIAGKTGSGKSTLLHVLIANAARWLSPDEVELYLVDFKKGVEFKAYADDRLPHARVVAVESDREFGLSVLRRLDEELKRRGDLFRDLGAQSIGSARARLAERGETTPLPRSLLIIDEFQEFFTEDDAIAQDATLLLDRLVRQGRAFGMHVLLGSQTLSGAYSLARSTVGQMAVRIALQCSETDSYLILSEDNGAARLLNRPGEAIYNDANGMVEGNSPFQVAWLNDDQRDETLSLARAEAERVGWKRPEPQIVFEGNAPARLERNHRLLDAIDTPPPAPVRMARAWLGEPVAIKDHTAGTLRRQGGANLLIVGQQPEAARAMFLASLLGLAAQHANESDPDAGAEITVIDATPPDDPDARILADLCDELAGATGLSIRAVGPREAEGVITALDDERAARDAEGRTDAPARYLLVNGLQRIKALRKSDDDFSFSFSDSDDDPPSGRSAADAFADLLREGPPLGLFTIAWCDSAAGLSRALDRRTITHFEQRAVMQMSAADSSTLIDSAAAGKLGLHRALLYNEELGTLEKFRPYAMPDRAALDAVLRRLRSAPGNAP
jgi:S-DNA-T family DNA segregation ATPase FtsK/SpoIIIE